MEWWVCEACGELAKGEYCSKCLANRPPSSGQPLNNEPGSYFHIIHGKGLMTLPPYWARVFLLIILLALLPLLILIFLPLFRR